MRISELSRASGVPVATVKYYLREGLLHDGRRTSATQAQYDDSHLARLRLVRALTAVGGLSVASTRAVLAHLDDPPASVHELLGSAHQLLESRHDSEIDTTAAQALVAEMGWQLEDDPEPVRRLALALAAIDGAGFQLPDGALVEYAKDMQAVAAHELAAVPLDSHEAAVRYVVLGTILVEPLLLALRRLAQVDASKRRFSATAATGADGR